MKVNIIGGGISGLAAGIYLQLSGVESTIFEKHSIPGGLCTSWHKGEYIFDSCAHWILGSDKGSSFYKIWSELLDMKKIKFHNHDIRVELETKYTKNKYGNSNFKLYTNLTQLEQYLIDLAPEDAREIRKFIKPMRIMQKFDLPPIFDKTSILNSTLRGIKMLRYIELGYWFLKLKNQTNFSYARKFKNPFLRESFELLYDGEEVNMMVLTMPLSVFDKKSAGYPLGGSMNFAKKIEERYLSLGGKIHYNTPVHKIITENGVAKGLLVRNNIKHFSDIIISAADWRFTVFDALDGKFVTGKMIAMSNLKSLDLFYSVMQFSFGIALPLDEQPHFSRFPLDQPLISPDGTVYHRFEIHIYNYDKSLAPEGKTSVTVSFSTRNRDFWIDARKQDRKKYREAKKEFTEAVVAILDKRLGGIRNKIEEFDVATPATFHRYTNNWKGSTQDWFPGKNIMAKSPVGFKLPGLTRFYYSSHWNQPGGGLPIAVMTGREVAKLICKEHKLNFNALHKINS